MPPYSQLEPYLKSASDTFSLTRSRDQQELINLTDALLSDPSVSAEILRDFIDTHSTPLSFKMAAMLFSSRKFMLSVRKRINVAVVFAMWGEQNRLLPASPENPNGEDSLRTKIMQLDWATRDTPISWSLYSVDDGCPNESGKIAQNIAGEYDSGKQIHILFLADHLPAADGPLQNLPSAEDSRKAGAIILGCRQAIDDGADVVIYTDADNSVHLGQIGLLLEPYANQGFKVVLGNRKHPESVLVKDAARWGIGIKNLRHMQRMAGHEIFSRNISDTQAAFKLYESGLLRKIITSPTVFDFSFDTDWISAFIALNEPFAQTPFAFLDSAEESATAKQVPMTTWETLLLGLIKSLRKHNLLKLPESRKMAAVIEEEIRDYRDLECIIHVLPDELIDAGEHDFGNPNIMSPEAMQKWFRKQKKATRP